MTFEILEEIKKIMKAKQFVALLSFLTLLIVSCTNNATLDPTAVSESPSTPPAVVDPTPLIESEPTRAPAVVDPTAVPAKPTPPAISEAEAALADLTPIEVTYFTPAQQEGPYYPVEKLAEQDNDLLLLAGQSAPPEGTPLFFGGFVYDATGMPLEGITVEIWQTDNNGAYLHPNDPATATRDQNFQFYGEAQTAVNGYYSFRTLLPGKYEPRPLHIHVKVRANDLTLLTTQFYFANDPTLDSAGITRGDNIHLIMDVAPAEDDNGSPILVGERDIVLSVELPDYYPKPPVQNISDESDTEPQAIGYLE